MMADLLRKQKIDINQNQDENDAYWLTGEAEGQLSVDVYQDKNNIYVKSTIAGVRPDELEISINNDMLTIRGSREGAENISSHDYFCQECFWGSFSRSIILPMDVQTNKISATIENGVLTITLPKLEKQRKIPVKIKD